MYWTTHKRPVPLEELGWIHIEGSKSDPEVTGRESFWDVFLRGISAA